VTRIKVCGCTSVSDVLIAAESGADAIGFIFAPSPRQVNVKTAAAIAREAPPFLTLVGVFVNPAHDDIERAREAIPAIAVQLSGDETPAFVRKVRGPVVKAIHVPPNADLATRAHIASTVSQFAGAMPLFDTAGATAGGTGRSFVWQLVREVAAVHRIIVAGGLTAQNVGACVREVRPYAVDVRSGVESEGQKDARKVRAFVRAVRECDAA